MIVNETFVKRCSPARIRSGSARCRLATKRSSARSSASCGTSSTMARETRPLARLGAVRAEQRVASRDRHGAIRGTIRRRRCPPSSASCARSTARSRSPTSPRWTTSWPIDGGDRSSRAPRRVRGPRVLLAAVGVLGVLSYTVARRTRELGIRRRARRGALGRRAARDDRDASMAAVGVALASPGALAVTRLARSMLYQVPPTIR